MKHVARQIQFQEALRPNQQYTCVSTIGSKVYIRARENDGTPVYIEQKYCPTLYTPVADKAQATHWAYDGTPLVAEHCESIWEAKQFADSTKVPVYGNIQCEYMALGDTYGAKDVPWDMQRLYIWNFDIETDSEHGYAPVDDPWAEVTAITVIWRHMGKMGTVVYGCKPYDAKPGELYIECDNEAEMLLRYLEDFRGGGDYPDILTGWNIQGYDIPYLVNRCKRLFSEETWIRFSPFERLQDKQVMFYGRPQTNIDLKGIAVLDYYEVYRKFTLSQQENYRLDTIAHVELKERKLSFAEVGSLRRLYKENYQKFIEYNIQDVRLVDRLEEKKKLLELVCALAYGAKCNFGDTFKQVRLWDVMIYHYLRAHGKQIPPRPEQQGKSEQYAGAFVKDPIVGLHRWVCSFDVASMYPHIIREWNLSPETKSRTRVEGMTVATVDKLLAQTVDTSSLPGMDVALAANGVLTRRDAEGFMPNMLKTLYDERNRYKGLQKKAKKDAENESDPAQKAALLKLADAYGNQQQVRKVNLNSAYGAMGSEYFRFFDVDLAEAVTVTGQMIIRWVAKDINTYLNRLFKTEKDYIVYSDTDSVYVNLAPVVGLMGGKDTPQTVEALHQFCERKVMPLINKTFEDIAAYLNVYTPCLSMVRDVITDKAVWTAKKRYIMNVHDTEGLRYHEPQLKVMGLESIKSSTPAIVRKMIGEAMKRCMRSTQDDLWAYVAQCEKEFNAASFEDIAFPRSCNGLAKYEFREKSVPIAVQGALTFNGALTRLGLDGEYESVREGEKIKYAYLKEPNPFHCHVISAPQGCPPEFEIEKWLDYPTQFAKTFLEPVRVIVDAVGWSMVEEASLW